MGRFSSSFCHGTDPSFLMFFSSEDDAVFSHNDPYLSSSSCGYASVDCTLSLGTPSTRLYQDDRDVPRLCSASSHMSNLAWDFVQGVPSKKESYISQAPHTSVGRGGDPLLARRCANCDTTSTPLWRNGPRGPKSLCNACGIRFKKEERREHARNSTAGGAPSAAGAATTDHHYHGNASCYDHRHHVSSLADHQSTKRR